MQPRFQTICQVCEFDTVMIANKMKSGLLYPGAVVEQQTHSGDETASLQHDCDNKISENGFENRALWANFNTECVCKDNFSECNLFGIRRKQYNLGSAKRFTHIICLCL